MCAFSVGAVAAFVTTPLDVAKTRIMLAKVHTPETQLFPAAPLLVLAASFKQRCQVMPRRQRAERARSLSKFQRCQQCRAERAGVALGQQGPVHASITWLNMDSVVETCLCSWLVLEEGLVAQFPS